MWGIDDFIFGRVRGRLVFCWLLCWVDNLILLICTANGEFKWDYTKIVKQQIGWRSQLRSAREATLVLWLGYDRWLTTWLWGEKSCAVVGYSLMSNPRKDTETQSHPARDESENYDGLLTKLNEWHTWQRHLSLSTLKNNVGRTYLPT